MSHIPTKSHQRIPALPKPVSALTLLERKRKFHNIAYDGSGGTVPPRLFLLRSPQSENKRKSPAHSSANSEDAMQENGRGVFEIGLGITEIAGEAGTGKSQLCLGLCVACTLNAYDNPSSDFPTKGGVPKDIAPPSISPQTSSSARYSGQAGATDRHQIRNPYASLSSHASPSKTGLNGSRSSPGHINAHKLNTPGSNIYTLAARQPKPPPKHTLKMPKSLYISMGEGSTPSQLAYRLRQIVDAQKGVASLSPLVRTDDILSRILTRFIRNADEFSELVDVTLPSMLVDDSKSNDKGRIGLVVLDSMAGLFRVPEDVQHNQKTKFYARRSQILFSCSAKLKKLSHEYGIPIVVVNQVTSSFSASSDLGLKRLNNPSYMHMERITPSLGLSWSNCVNTRFLLTRNETTDDCSANNHRHNGGGHTSPSTSNPTSSSNTRVRFIRHARVLLSSSMPHLMVEFKIDAGGGIVV